MRSAKLARMPKLDASRPFIAVRIALLTVSDTRELANDTSGDTLASMIAGAGHQLADRAIVKDDVDTIRAKVRAWIDDPSIDVVISTGGTGFTGRDVTPEAIRPLFEKEIEGFSTVFHMISFEQGRHLDHPVARVRRAGARHLHFLPAGLTRRLQGRLERHPGAPARQPAPALQPGRDHAAAGGAPALGVKLVPGRVAWVHPGSSNLETASQISCSSDARDRLERHASASYLQGLRPHIAAAGPHLVRSLRQHQLRSPWPMILAVTGSTYISTRAPLASVAFTS